MILLCSLYLAGFLDELFFLHTLLLHTGSKVGEVATLVLLEAVEASIFNDNAVLNHADTTALLDCSETMGHHDGGPVLHHIVKSGLHLALRHFIEGTCSLVEEKNFRLANDCPGDSDALLLTAGKFAALDAAHNLVSLLQLETALLSLSALVDEVSNRFGLLGQATLGSHDASQHLDILVKLVLFHHIDNFLLVDVRLEGLEE